MTVVDKQFFLRLSFADLAQAALTFDHGVVVRHGYPIDILEQPLPSGLSCSEPLFLQVLGVIAPEALGLRYFFLLGLSVRQTADTAPFSLFLQTRLGEGTAGQPPDGGEIPM